MATVESRLWIADLERLYVEHGERVRAICASILRDRQESEDAAQQVFVSALRALQGGTQPRDGGAWLAAIARHESWARARGSAQSPLSDELADVEQEDPATAAVRRSELADAWHAIEELPPTQRAAFLLREIRGLAYDEVAEDLRVSNASVRSLLTRARRTLRIRLERGAAALTGASWFNIFARLFGDASTPAIWSATRTGAVGLGALVVANGAGVAPRPTHQLAVAHTQPAKVAARPVAVKTAAPAEPTRLEVRERVSRVSVRVAHRGRGGRRGSESRSAGRQATVVIVSSSSGGGSSRGSDGGSSSSGPGPAVAEAAPAVSTTGSDGGGHDGGSSSSGPPIPSVTQPVAVVPTSGSGSGGHDGGTSSNSGPGSFSGSGGTSGSSGSSHSGDSGTPDGS